MEIKNENLLEILKQFDSYLTRKMRIIAVGGTALTLLGKKASTKDIDFCFLNDNDKSAFVKTAEKLGYRKTSGGQLLGNGIAIDTYSKDYIFCVQLPEDYVEKSETIIEFRKLEIRALSPLDLLISKGARFNDRDKEDIAAILKSYAINKKDLAERWARVMENSLVRDEKENLNLILAMMNK